MASARDFNSDQKFTGSNTRVILNSWEEAYITNGSHRQQELLYKWLDVKLALLMGELNQKPIGVDDKNALRKILLRYSASLRIKMEEVIVQQSNNVTDPLGRLIRGIKDAGYGRIIASQDFDALAKITENWKSKEAVQNDFEKELSDIRQDLGLEPQIEPISKLEAQVRALTAEVTSLKEMLKPVLGLKSAEAAAEAKDTSGRMFAKK